MQDVTGKKSKIKISINPDSTPILYTDNLSISANDDGVVLNAVQKMGNTNQGRIVARIGMSRSHAQKLVEKLGKLLLVTQPKPPEEKLSN